LETPEIKAGTLVCIYPKSHYTGYIIRAALYCKGEIKSGLDRTAFEKGKSSVTTDIMYHTILTTGGTMTLPGDIYEVDIIQDPPNSL